MKLMLVDDEIYIVRALQKNINWNQIGIDNLFIAFNVEKAQEILEKEEIDIVVTDIEMPRKSGLELLEWMKKRGYEGKVICLTCHDEFEYIQRAMQLHASDYVLKPVDFQKFTEIVEKTVKEAREEKRQKDERKKGVLWEYHHSRLETTFWKDILQGNQDLSPEALARDAKNLNIAWDFNQQYQLVLFTLKRIYRREQDWNEKTDLMQYIVHNISQDLILKKEDKEKSGWMDKKHMWVIISEENSVDLQEKIEKFIETCNQITGIGLVAYVDEICYGEELYSSYQRLLNYDKENVSLEQGIFDIFMQTKEQTQNSEWYLLMRKLLREKKYQKAEDLIDGLWNGSGYIVPKELLMNICRGQYEIYHYLEENCIHGEQFWNDELMNLWRQSLDSADMYKGWLRASVRRIEELCGFLTAEKKVIIQIQEYISFHIEERISREDIAKYVNFSSDYVSRLFKKETGTALSEYIMEEKMKKAKFLIEENEDSIGNIAMRLGYNSFSYFSEVFRKFTGVLPREYKKINMTE